MDAFLATENDFMQSMAVSKTAAKRPWWPDAEETKPPQHDSSLKRPWWSDAGETGPPQRESLLKRRDHESSSKELKRPMSPPPGEWNTAESSRGSADEEYISAQRDETEMAKMFGIPWKLRGPPGPEAPDETKFKGQRWRQGTQRWGNRGGSRRQWYGAYYSALSTGASAAEASNHADHVCPEEARKLKVIEPEQQVR